MKQTADGKNVSSRSWYYLLDWNEKDNWMTTQDLFGKSRLHELTFMEYKLLFKTATESDLKNM